MSQSTTPDDPFRIADDGPEVRETDTGRTLDPDVNDDVVDSAEADRLAAGAYEDPGEIDGEEWDEDAG